MTRIDLVVALVVAGVITIGAAAQKSTRAEFRLWFEDGGPAPGAAASLVWDGGSATDVSDRWGRVTFVVPRSVAIGTLSADAGAYCLPPTLVLIAKVHPGSQPDLVLERCR